MDRERLKLLLYALHKRSFHNEQIIKHSLFCVCFHCKRLFYGREVTEWCDSDSIDNRTALCPYCGVDSVIGDKDGDIYIEPAMTELMNIQFFGDGIDSLEKIPYLDD